MTRYYDGSYVRLAYPGGDVPVERGVCTDVVIRAMRAAGVDLQQAVHEDMRRDFAAYPALWGLRRPDRNIDHRRVPNLETWLRRAGHALPASGRAARLPARRPRSAGACPAACRTSAWCRTGGRGDGSGRPLVVHNIGAGARVEDVLLAWPPVGHFRPFREAAPPAR